MSSSTRFLVLMARMQDDARYFRDAGPLYTTRALLVADLWSIMCKSERDGSSNTGFLHPKDPKSNNLSTLRSRKGPVGNFVHATVGTVATGSSRISPTHKEHVTRAAITEFNVQGRKECTFKRERGVVGIMVRALFSPSACMGSPIP